MAGTFLGIDIDAMDLQRAKIWATEGNFTWICPAGVTGIFFSGCGFGGDGGKNTASVFANNIMTYGASGAGGGSGAYAERVFVSVIPGTEYTISISRTTGVTAFGITLGNGGKGADASAATTLGGVRGIASGIGAVSGNVGGNGSSGGPSAQPWAYPCAGGGAGLGVNGTSGQPLALQPTASAMGRIQGSGSGGGGIGSTGLPISPPASATLKGSYLTNIAHAIGNSGIPMFGGRGGSSISTTDADTNITPIHDGLAGAGGGGGSPPNDQKGGSAEYGGGGGGSCAMTYTSNVIYLGGTGGKALAIIEY